MKNISFPLNIESLWMELEQCAEMDLTMSIGVSKLSSKKIGYFLTYVNLPPTINM
jgi:diketogulonate reductase-like aldo/keto reductase